MINRLDVLDPFGFFRSGLTSRVRTRCFRGVNLFLEIRFPPIRIGEGYAEILSSQRLSPRSNYRQPVQLILYSAT